MRRIASARLVAEGLVAGRLDTTIILTITKARSNRRSVSMATFQVSQSELAALLGGARKQMPSQETSLDVAGSSDVASSSTSVSHLDTPAVPQEVMDAQQSNPGDPLKGPALAWLNGFIEYEAISSGLLLSKLPPTLNQQTVAASASCAVAGEGSSEGEGSYFVADSVVVPISEAFFARYVLPLVPLGAPVNVSSLIVWLGWGAVSPAVVVRYLKLFPSSVTIYEKQEGGDAMIQRNVTCEPSVAEVRDLLGPPMLMPLLNRAGEVRHHPASHRLLLHKLMKVKTEPSAERSSPMSSSPPEEAEDVVFAKSGKKEATPWRQRGPIPPSERQLKRRLKKKLKKSATATSSGGDGDKTAAIAAGAAASESAEGAVAPREPEAVREVEPSQEEMTELKADVTAEANTAPTQIEEVQPTHDVDGGNGDAAEITAASAEVCQAQQSVGQAVEKVANAVGGDDAAPSATVQGSTASTSPVAANASVRWLLVPHYDYNWKNRQWVLMIDRDDGQGLTSMHGVAGWSNFAESKFVPQDKSKPSEREFVFNVLAFGAFCSWWHGPSAGPYHKAASHSIVVASKSEDMKKAVKWCPTKTSFAKPRDSWMPVKGMWETTSTLQVSFDKLGMRMLPLLVPTTKESPAAYFSKLESTKELSALVKRVVEAKSRNARKQCKKAAMRLAVQIDEDPARLKKLQKEEEERQMEARKQKRKEEKKVVNMHRRAQVTLLVAIAEKKLRKEAETSPEAKQLMQQPLKERRKLLFAEAQKEVAKERRKEHAQAMAKQKKAMKKGKAAQKKIDAGLGKKQKEKTAANEARREAKKRKRQEKKKAKALAAVPSSPPAASSAPASSSPPAASKKIAPTATTKTVSQASKLVHL